MLPKAVRLRDEGVRELTLLGQNVNSYHDRSGESVVSFPASGYTASAGFGNTFRSRGGAGAYFAELLAEVWLVERWTNRWCWAIDGVNIEGGVMGGWCE